MLNELFALVRLLRNCFFSSLIRLNECRNLFVCNLHFLQTITFLLGITIGAFLSPYAATLNWPTAEMRERGQTIQLLFGAIVAALSGTGAALAESNANISSVVGVAIAAALLPPTVNFGICVSYIMFGQYFVVRVDAALLNALCHAKKLIWYVVNILHYRMMHAC